MTKSFHPPPSDRNADEAREDVHALVERLHSLRDGPSVVQQLVAIGEDAVPALAEALLEGRPRTVYQPRCWMVESLADLRAYDVLLEYLNRPNSIADPEVRFAEDAVVNTAARALYSVPSDRAFSVLLRLAQERSLPGVVEALGAYRRPEATSYLIRALESDLANSAACDALQLLRRKAKDPLISQAFRRKPSPPDPESFSSLKRRRACLHLLTSLKLTLADQRRVRNLLFDKDPEIILAVSKVLASSENAFFRSSARQRLSSIVSSMPWPLKDEAKELLLRLQNEPAKNDEDPNHF